jgi:hypothetical protein
MSMVWKCLAGEREQFVDAIDRITETDRAFVQATDSKLIVQERSLRRGILISGQTL